MIYEDDDNEDSRDRWRYNARSRTKFRVQLIETENKGHYVESFRRSFFLFKLQQDHVHDDQQRHPHGVLILLLFVYEDWIYVSELCAPYVLQLPLCMRLQVVRVNDVVSIDHRRPVQNY